MRTVSRLCAAALFLLALPADSPAQSVAQVNTIEVAADEVDAYLAGMKKMKVLYEQILPSVEMRIWRTAIGGASSGLLTVVTEFENMEAWAAGTSTLSAHAGYQPLVEELQATGRVMVSVSIVSDITP